jgi:pimeloyl-ACP methyl ester carboxylesterase
VEKQKRQMLLLGAFLAVNALILFNPFKAKTTVVHADLAAPIAANARAFTLGSLEFKACELPQKKSGATTSAFCAPFAVAENPAEPQGRKIALRLALIKSSAAAADRDIVVYLAGGPGQSAIDSWPQMAGALAPLLKHHHVLLLDQRGTGGSNVLTCKSEEAAQAVDNFDAETIRKSTRECLAAVSDKADPRYYTTTLALEDLEAVRRALGSPRFDLVGVSYGTRVAQQYAMRHADGVRSIVLDSVAPNELVLGAEFAANLDAALKAQFALCTANAACAKAYVDPYASLFKLRDALRAKPRTLAFRDPVTFAATERRLNEYSLAGLVRIFAYNPETAALLPLSIESGLHDNFAPLAGQTQVLRGDLEALSENAMQISVICTEDADLLTSRAEDSSTLLGTALSDALRTQCEIWPRGTRPADFHVPFTSDKPVLVLEGEFDPVTPPRYGEQVLKNLSNARLLVAKGQGHNVIGRGCIPKLVGEFVDQLEPRTLDAKCVEQLGPTPAFIDFNGAAP